MFVALALVSVGLVRRGVDVSLAVVPGAVGALLAFFSLVAPGVVRPLASAWEALGHLLGRITTPILLVLVFAFVVVPLGLLLRLLGKDVFRRARDPKATTYWLERTRRTFEPSDFERLS
jgi:hypothetical protein